MSLIKSAATLANILRDRGEPPLDLGIQEATVREKQIFVVTVPQGKDTPYQVKDRGFYIRTGATNRLITRHELDAIYGTRPENLSLGWSRPLGLPLSNFASFRSYLTESRPQERLTASNLQRQFASAVDGTSGDIASSAGRSRAVPLAVTFLFSFCCGMRTSAGSSPGGPCAGHGDGTRTPARGAV
jgi:hypothetical protein